ncbi:MAG: elongation factor G [Chloroflexi bacterium]|nr:elongation factor G [Chloroflexota bacterium]
MQSYQTESLRNVVLLSHSGAGKTSLAEALLFATGAVSRLGKVDDGTTTSDFDPEEVKRKISISTSLIPVEWKGQKVNLLDAPGYSDFIGELRSAVRVADAAVIVVCAASGVEVGTELAWQLTQEAGLPRLIYVNKMDRENADFGRTMDQLREAFGAQCVAVALPIGSQAGFTGIVDVLSQKAYLGPKLAEAPVPGDLAEALAEAREKLIEAVAETDDDLISKYLEGEELSDEEVRRGLRAATRSGAIVPVLVGSALQNIAAALLLDALIAYAPSPPEREAVVARNVQTDQEERLSPGPAGPLAALVFKTTADPYVGKLNYFRVYSGTIASDSQVWNASKGKPERLGQLYVMRGKTQEPVASLVAGDIGAVAKLQDTGTNDTLSSREHPLVLEGVRFPSPLYGVAVHPKTKADVDKLHSALSRAVEEDPTLHRTLNADTGEIVLSGMGDTHVDVAVERMRRKFGADVTTSVPKVSYKETVTAPTKAEYKHKKQTGGHGQYGHVLIEIEPLPRGSGFEFAERIFGGAIPKNYVPAVEKGVRAALGEGILAHFPVVDVKVTVYDGSYHAVDSSDMSFQIAGNQAFKKGAGQAHPVLLEPVMNVRITAPDQFMGAISSDLNGKRARVLGMTQEGGAAVVEAQVPLAEMLRYAIDLRSITQGRGSFTMEYSHDEEVPQHLAQRIIEQAKKEATAERA